MKDVLIIPSCAIYCRYLQSSIMKLYRSRVLKDVLIILSCAIYCRLIYPQHTMYVRTIQTKIDIEHTSVGLAHAHPISKH